MTSYSPPIPGFPPFVKSYDLVMGVTGTFDYYCLVHGVMMHGVVHVLSTSAKLPHDQEDVQDQISQARAEMLADGQALREQAKAIVARKHIVLVGIGEMAKVGMIEIVRFFPSTIKIHVGETLTFESMSMMPHTFTIGNDTNPDPTVPYGDGSNYTGGLFNRFVPPGVPGPLFTLTVNAAMNVPFLCQFHDTLGMVGQLIAK